MRWAFRAAAVLAVLLLGVPRTAVAADGPVAVMPFKNLNGDPELEWLRAGIAETLLADLRRAGTPIVERDQLDRALTEIALQGLRETDESTAARAGRITGARTVVLGAFQKAGRSVRITARFVSVESGLVQETAKITGPLTRIFHLQDEIVARLLGETVEKPGARPTPRRRPAPRSGEQTLRAYRLYAKAVTTASDAERVGLLREALEIDPAFTYAEEDLRALERRLDAHRARGDEVMRGRTDEALAFIRDVSRPEDERSTRAMAVLGELAQAQQYARLEKVSVEIAGLGLPPLNGMSIDELATYYRFLALDMVKRTDEALQVGEHLLETFPDGRFRQAVELRMRAVISQRTAELDGRAGFEAEMKSLAEDRKEAEAWAERTGRALPDVRRMVLDHRSCTAAFQHKQYRLALEHCDAVWEKWKANEDPQIGEIVFSARWLQALSHVELGEFARARALADGLVKQDPKRARTLAIPLVSGMWPRE